VKHFYLTRKAREVGRSTRFTLYRTVREDLTKMPCYVVNRTLEALNSHKKSLDGRRILLIGSLRPMSWWATMWRRGPGGLLRSVCTGDPLKLGASAVDRNRIDRLAREIIEQLWWGGDRHELLSDRRLAEWVLLIIDKRNAINGTRWRRGKSGKCDQEITIYPACAIVWSSCSGLACNKILLFGWPSDPLRSPSAQNTASTNATSYSTNMPEWSCR